MTTQQMWSHMMSLPAGASGRLQAMTAKGHVTIHTLNFASSIKVKFVVKVNGVPIVVWFNSNAAPAGVVGTKINLEPNDVVEVEAISSDIMAADVYVHIHYEDSWSEYSRQFDAQLEETLTK